MAKIGYGIQLWIGASPAATTATIKFAEILSFTPPNLSVDEVETTSNDSPDHMREFIPGLIDPGEASFEFNFIPGNAGETLIREMMIGREVRYMEIRYTQLSPVHVFGGRGFFKEFTPATPIDDRMTGSATLRASGSWAEVTP